MQIAVFTKKPKRAAYSDLRKSAELLNYLSSNNITSASELENRLNAAAEDYQNSVLKKKELAELEVTVEKQKEERDYLSGLFNTYKRDIENNPYEDMERQLEAERQEQQAEQERQEENYKNPKER